MSGKLCFLIVDLTFQGQWQFFRVQRQPPCGGRFACLASHPSLALRNGGTVEVVKARCQNFSSKRCLSFGPFETRSPSARAAVQESQLWDSYQLAGSKMFRNTVYAVQESEAAKL